MRRDGAAPPAFPGTPLERFLPVDHSVVLMTIPADAASVTMVRQAVSGLGDLDDWDPVFLADVRVAISEACENAIAHGYPDHRPGTVVVRVELTGDGVAVNVRDDGIGFPALDAPGSGAGLGMAIMGTLADELSVTSPPGGPTELSMTFHIVRAARGS